MLATPAPVQKPFPWWLVAAVVGVVILVSGGSYGLIRLSQKTPTVTPIVTAPTATPTPISQKMPTVTPTVTAPTPSPTATPVPIVPSSTGTIQGTSTFSFDQGRQVTSGADVWWEQQTNTIRSMNPLGNAKLVNLGIVDFNSITPSQLRSYTYTTTPIDGNNDSSNQLVTGDVFAATTNGGNHAKVLVVMYGYNLQIQWVTYRG